MSLTRHQLGLLSYATRDLVARRNLGGQPLPPGMVDLLHLLQRAMSEGGHENDCGGGQSEQDTLIGVTEAAAILGCSPRHVRRIAADLDGQPVGGRWVFQRQTVVDYAHAKGARR